MYVPSHLFPSMLHVYACNTRFSYLATLVNAERHGWKIPYALRAMQLCVCIRMWVRMCQRVSVYVYRLRYRTVDRLPPWSTSTVGAEFSAERQTIAAKWLNCSQLNKCSPRFSLSLCMPERWSLVACRFFPTSPSLLFFSFLLSFFLSLLFPTRSCRGFPAAICRGTRDPGWTGPPRISSSSLSFPVLLSPLSLSLSLSLSLFSFSLSLLLFSFRSLILSQLLSRLLTLCVLFHSMVPRCCCLILQHSFCTDGEPGHFSRPVPTHRINLLSSPDSLSLRFFSRLWSSRVKKPRDFCLVISSCVPLCWKGFATLQGTLGSLASRRVEVEPGRRSPLSVTLYCIYVQWIYGNYGAEGDYL